MKCFQGYIWVPPLAIKTRRFMILCWTLNWKPTHSDDTLTQGCVGQPWRMKTVTAQSIFLAPHISLETYFSVWLWDEKVSYQTAVLTQQTQGRLESKDQIRSQSVTSFSARDAISSANRLLLCSKSHTSNFYANLKNLLVNMVAFLIYVPLSFCDLAFACMCWFMFVLYSLQTGSHADQIYGGFSLLPELKVSQRCGSSRNLRTSWWLRVCGGETRPRPAGSTYHPWPAGAGGAHRAGWECQLQTKDHSISQRAAIHWELGRQGERRAEKLPKWRYRAQQHRGGWTDRLW